MGALLVLLLPVVSDAAISVLAHQPGNLVLRLRDHIVVDERELVAARSSKRAVCSSLQGPSCRDAEAALLVDGVVSRRLREAHPEAFLWDFARDQKVAILVSQLIQRLSEGANRSSSSRPGETVLGAFLQPPRSRCFELETWRLPPFVRFLPEKFGAGLPADTEPRWHGVWHVVRCPYPATPAKKVYLGEALLRRGWCLRLFGRGANRSAALRFARPLVLRRLVLGVTDSVARSPESTWGAGSFVCGHLQGEETWCRSLDQVARDARASKTLGAGSGTFYTDVGDSLMEVDEVVFSSVPLGGLTIASIAVSATKHWQQRPQQEVVLLRRPLGDGETKPPGLFEGVLTKISPDAAVWDANQILEHRLRLGGRVTAVQQLAGRTATEAPEKET
ncbi:unnamed protein product [Effrenium voratum]|uniref:Uncharacterized protein n=1 Tax=Effrenium voratum TaxID=2562239 RepID=A0AA36ICL2_9DINO|nr:unnamed protein product [Effrenium voratum]